MTPTTRTLSGERAIAAAFNAARREGRAALIPYLTAGYPTPAASPALVLALQAGGADLIELGVPFSDPVADGPTIQRAAGRALAAGMTPTRCLDLCREVRRRGVGVPLVLMGYYNPVHAYGPGAYVRDCAAAGVDGLIVPDLPPDEAGPLAGECRAAGLALIHLVAPTTPPERAARVAGETSGFLYVVSRLGTTGGTMAAGEALAGRLCALRSVARTPLAVGFGITRPAEVAAVAREADGVVVGSAVVERADEGPDALRAYVASLAGALEGREKTG